MNNIRLDHIAYRVKNRHKTSLFFKEAFGYKVQQEFIISFDDGSKAQCIALEPPEKKDIWTPWTSVLEERTFHLAPEIFVSDGTPNSIVDRWVKEHNNIGGIHHLAYQVDSVEDTVKEWKSKGWANFTTENPNVCGGVVQIFSEPNPITNVVY